MNSRLLIRGTCLVAATLATGFLGSCAGSAKYNGMVEDHRKLQREHKQLRESLTRENRVLFEENAELETQNALLSDGVATLKSELSSTTQQVKSLRDSLDRSILSCTEKINALKEQSRSAISSVRQGLVHRIDSLSKTTDSLFRVNRMQQKRCAARTEELHDSLVIATTTCEKEVYALEKLKSELFAQLREQERTIQKLRTPDTHRDSSTSLQNNTEPLPRSDDPR